MLSSPHRASRSWIRALLVFLALICLVLTALPLAGAQTESAESAESTAVSSETTPIETTTALPAEEITASLTEPDDSLVADSSTNTAEPESVEVLEESETIAEEPLMVGTGNIVTCDEGCNAQILNDLIQAAGSEPTVIALPAGDVLIERAIAIPTGANITFTDSGANANVVRPAGAKFTMINVAQGGQLTLDGNIYINGTRTDKSSGLVMVRGTFILNNGAVMGAYGMEGYHKGSVTIAGADAYFEMNGGFLYDNRRNFYGTCSTAACRGAGNLAVTDGAHAVMNGGEISWGGGSREGGGDVGGVGIFNGGSFEMNGGAIKDNFGWAGGVGVYQLERSKGSVEEFEARRASFTLNDGEISKNKAYFGGGGVLVYSNAEFHMKGGIVKRNESTTQGGGIAVVDDYKMGQPGTTREFSSFGENLGYTHEEWTQRSPGRFVLEGGTITQNWAPETGGGVYVLSADVTLKGGDIIDNSAGGQGGGLYVGTISYSAQLFNVLVTDNKASHIGGGIWLCPTGSLEFHMTEGGAVFDNTAKTYGDDLAHDNLNGAGSLNTTMSRHMIGFGETHYFQDGGKPDGVDLPRFDAENPGQEFIYQGDVAKEDRIEGLEYRRAIYQEGLKQVTTDAAKAQAKSFAQLRITQNKAPRGAGIGSNGGIIIGTDDLDIPVEKFWQDHIGNPIDTLVDRDNNPSLPESINVQLFAQVSDHEKLPVGEPRSISPNAKGEWKYVFEDLPRNVDGQLVTYSLEELPIEGFTSTVAKNGSTETELSFTVTNKAASAKIKVVKTWTSLDGKPLTGSELPVSLDVALHQWINEESVPVTGSSNEPITATLNADNDWSYEFTDLPLMRNGEAIAYDIKELNAPNGFTATTSVEKTDEGYILHVENSQQPTTVEVNKLWKDTDGEELSTDLPESIELQLVRNQGGEQFPVGGKVTVTPDESGAWSYTFNNVAKFFNGEVAKYSVIETPITGFTSTVDSSIDDESGNTVAFLTNTKDKEDVPPTTSTPTSSTEESTTPESTTSEEPVPSTTPSITEPSTTTSEEPVPLTTPETTQPTVTTTPVTTEPAQPFDVPSTTSSPELPEETTSETPVIPASSTTETDEPAQPFDVTPSTSTSTEPVPPTTPATNTESIPPVTSPVVPQTGTSTAVTTTPATTQGSATGTTSSATSSTTRANSPLQPARSTSSTTTARSSTSGSSRLANTGASVLAIAGIALLLALSGLLSIAAGRREKK